MGAIVRIIRKNDYFGRKRDLDVYINGKFVGHIAPVSKRDFNVAFGNVKVYVRMDDCLSEECVYRLDEKNKFCPLEVEVPQVPLYSIFFGAKRFFRLAAARSHEFEE